MRIRRRTEPDPYSPTEDLGGILEVEKPKPASRLRPTLLVIILMCAVVGVGFLVNRPTALEREAQAVAEDVALAVAQGRAPMLTEIVADAEQRLGCELEYAAGLYINAAEKPMDAAINAHRALWEYMEIDAAVAEADVQTQREIPWQDPKSGEVVPAQRVRVAVAIGKCR